MIMKKVCRKLFSIAIILAIVIGVLIPNLVLIVLSIACKALDVAEPVKTLTENLHYWVVSQLLWVLIIAIVVMGYHVVKGELRKLINNF